MQYAVELHQDRGAVTSLYAPVLLARGQERRVAFHIKTQAVMKSVQRLKKHYGKIRARSSAGGKC